MYIRQECLFSFEDIMSMQPKNRLELIFENLDLTQISREIKNNFDRGRSDYNPTPIVRALLAQQIEQIPKRKTMIKRLNNDPVFRYVCGFDIIGNIPSEANFSRYYNKLVEGTSLENFYLELLNKALKMNLIDIETVSIDSSALESYERAKPRKQIDINNPNTPDWGSKNDCHGNQLKWYG
ncbi:transposase [Orenia metallireducens]|uniref:transposase n=1 Tax=Orenia metallireducens TaxID=1413210 RepID=UPI0009F433BE|nr:transposase [Orenia metallireducens]